MAPISVAAQRVIRTGSPWSWLELPTPVRDCYTFSVALSPATRLVRGVELDMYLHVPSRIDGRCISQLTPRSRDHHLFLHAAGSLCKVCVRAWLDRGADTSRSTPCEPLKSAFRWAEEAHGDNKLLSMLRAPAAAHFFFFFFFSSEGIGGSAPECVRPGWGRRPLIFF